MLLKVVDGTEFRDIPIQEGSIFLLPGTLACLSPDTHLSSYPYMSATLVNTPHNPVRFPNTVGIVIECTRPEASKGKPVLGHFYALRLPSFLDRLRWYCRNPVHTEPTIIREEVFHVENLGQQLKPYIEAWMADEDLRKCKECGTTAPPK